MKRIIAAVIAALMIAAAFAGCGYDPYVDGSKSDATEASTEAATEAPKAANYKNTLAGLRDYMATLGFITISDNNSNVTTMQADKIGAEKGNRYTMGNIRVELYVFNTKKLSKTAKETLDSVSSDGYFTLYDKQVTAYVSDNGKYLMIYSDSDIVNDDKTTDNYKRMQSAIAAFKGFYK